MPSVPPNSLRLDELPDYSFQGPFGGIQSEVGLSQIGRTGFAEVQNLLFRLSRAQSVPGFTALPAVDAGSPIMGIADFFNVQGNRIPVVWIPSGMFQWSGGVWTQITGPLTGNTSQFFQSAVVGYKLFFSQQKDVVQVWDGINNTFGAASANAVPAKYLAEIDFHLVVANTIEASVAAPNRVHWSGSNDGTDWSSFNSGQVDLFNSFGPITGLTKLFQYGYAMQQWGITQIVPTGNGLAPFAFVPMGAVAKGNILPYSLASFGEMIACYVGKDDVYMFDGTSSEGIGSRPIDGNRRLGARSRIFADLFVALQTNIFGFILTSANGFVYESYWLVIPSLNKAWVYHFDEGNWTQVYFTKGQLQGPISSFPLQQIPRIMDLVGPIATQSWTPSQLSNANQLDTLVVSDTIADSLSYLNVGAKTASPTIGSINTNDGWYIRSGQLTFEDTRHSHSSKKFRLIIEDNGTVTFTLRVTNEYNNVIKKTVTLGTGSGKTLTEVIGIDISGKYITWELSGPQQQNVSLVEFGFVYDVGGEVQGGQR